MSAVSVPIKTLAFALFSLIYLSIQVYLPTRCVADGTYCRVGWTMMSTRLDSPAFFVRRASGEEIPLTDIDPDRTLVHVERRSTDTRFIVRHICEQIPDTTAVRVIHIRPQRQEVTPCN